MVDNWKCEIKDCSKGSARIESFSVSPQDAMMANIRGAGIYPGEYKRLYVDGVLMMSDTPSERLDHYSFINKAKGKVLINGLGLGCCLKSVLAKECVTSVTVIEKNQDVIDLVSPYFENVEIINDCSFEYKPLKSDHFNATWHDIWPYISEDNLPEMHKLHRKYGRKSDWQGSWARPEIERIRASTNKGRRFNYF